MEKSLKIILEFKPKIKTIEYVITVLAILLLWELYVRAFGVPSWILPAPSEVIQYSLIDKDIPPNFLITVCEVITGFFVATAVGIALAILISQSAFFERGLYPLLSFFQSVPKSALAPVFVVWFGYGSLPRIIVAFLIVFFPILVNTLTGLAITKPELLDLMCSMRATKLQILTKIRLPNSLPFIFSALKIAAPTSVIGAVVAEFMSGNSGLGHLVLKANFLVDMRLLFASVFGMAVIGTAMFLVVVIAENRLLPWYKR